MENTWQEYLDRNEGRQIEQLLELLRIPSVSALPEHRPDVARAAAWVADHLRQIGVPEVEVLETGGSPLVVGAWHVDDGQPTALIYGHYDVQPADPLDLWQTPPFEPAIRDEKIYARGASDDKGSLITALDAIEALAKTQGGPPINLKFFIEGEEEIGSPSLAPVIAAERQRLACDFVISADGAMFSPEQPSLTLSAKGLAAGQIDLVTANSDLHSGEHGARVPNAIQALVQLAATFHTPDGRVAVDGFYDKVREFTTDERQEIAAIPFDEAAYQAELDLPALWGEAGYSTLERAWIRPTFDMNGIWGGFQGAGSKTVTPAAAHLKFTCRLVADQEPEEILALVERHVEQHCPAGARATVERLPGSARPFEINRDHPALQAAAGAIREQYGREPLMIRLGGTLPVADIFQRELGADMIFFAWEMPENRPHAPNEWFGLNDYRAARRSYCRYLNALAR